MKERKKERNVIGKIKLTDRQIENWSYIDFNCDFILLSDLLLIIIIIVIIITPHTLHLTSTVGIKLHL